MSSPIPNSAKQMRSADKLVLWIMQDPRLIDQIKSDPIRELQILAAKVVDDTPPADGPIVKTDRWIYRLVVGALGATMLIAVIGTVYLGLQPPDAAGVAIKVPDVITAIGSAAVGAVAGLLAPSPNSQH